MSSPIHRSWSILLQTVPGASRALFLFSLLTHNAQAIVDTNTNGVSDLWEKTYNSGSLITNFDPLADTDGDGWTNGTEAISGTDPGNANTPTGILRPEILQTPAVYITGPNGDPEIFTPAAVSITWPTLAGKQYTLFASVDLTAGSWLAIDNDTPRIGTTAPMGNAFPIAQPDGSSPPTMFYRVAINDADSDGDTLTNHEEAQLNTDPFSIDTDRDGLLDNIDPAPLTSATLANPDGANPPVGSTTNLLGFWDFESQNAPAFPVVFPDKSGNNRLAAGTTGPQALGLPSLAGRIGPGTITVPSTTINGSPTYTVTGWFKLGKDTIKNSSTTIFKSLYAIYDRGGAGPSPQLAPLGQGTGLFIRKSTTGGEEWFVGGYRQTTFPNGNALTDFNGHYFQRPAGTSDDAKWHHFAVTRSATSFGQKVYFDGVLIIERPLLEYSVSHDPLPPPLPAQATTFTFGALYPGHAPSTFQEAFIDRVRVQSTLLNATEILGYYRQDIDHDGLWDATETSTALWRDTNSNGQASATEFSYSSSPFHWQPTNTDTDSDGLTNTVEQNLGTQISNPDTDGDLLPDGWEVTYNLNPSIANNTSTDGDQDNLSLIDEYRYNTNPTLPNTDGDSNTDGLEVNQGSNPNDNSDDGNPIPADQKISILLGIGDKSGSHSEDYVLHCYRLDPQTGQEQRIYTLRSGGFGEYNEETKSIFKKGESYTFQIDWQSSNLNSRPASPGVTAEGPDYDYTFKVQPQGSDHGILIDAYDPKTKTIGDPILAENASDVATTEAEFKDKYERKRIYLLPVDLISDLNDDGQITAADNPLRDAAMASGATDEIKDKGTEYILQDDVMSNGAWDNQDQDGNICYDWPQYGNLDRAPAAGEMDDDAIAIEVKAPSFGVAWFTHEAIESLSFFREKECLNAIAINLEQPFELSTQLPERLWIKFRPTVSIVDTVKGKLTFHIGKSTSEEWGKIDLPLTLVPDFGCEKFFEAARNYIFERNTQVFLWDYKMPDRFNPVQIFRLCVMREEATTAKGYDAFANQKKGIEAVALDAGFNQPTVMVNGNQCFFRAGYDEIIEPDLPLDLAHMAFQIADGCHGRVIIAGLTAGISSDNFDNTTEPAPGSDLAGPDPIPVGNIAGIDGILGTADDILNPRAGNPGGKFFSQNGTTWNFAAGQAIGTEAVGGLSTNYASNARSDEIHQMIGRVPCSEAGKGCVFTATQIYGVGQAPAFAAAAKKSGNKMLSPSTDVFAQELFILDGGDGAIALKHIDPVGNLRKAYIGRNSATGLPFYANNYVQFWATKPRP